MGQPLAPLLACICFGFVLHCRLLKALLLPVSQTLDDARARLRELEITEPELDDRQRNDFQDAMANVDEEYVQELLAKQGQSGEDGQKVRPSWPLLQVKDAPNPLHSVVCQMPQTRGSGGQTGLSRHVILSFAI